MIPRELAWHAKDFEIYFTLNEKPSKVKNKKGQNSSLFFLSFRSIPSPVPSSSSPLIKGLLFVKALGQSHLVLLFASLDLP